MSPRANERLVDSAPEGFAFRRNTEVELRPNCP